MLLLYQQIFIYSNEVIIKKTFKCQSKIKKCMGFRNLDTCRCIATTMKERERTTLNESKDLRHTSLTGKYITVRLY